MLATKDFNTIIDRIVKHYDPERIILFGSYARGEATEESDVDLLIVAQTNLPGRARFPAVRRLLADYPFAFDVYLKTPEEYERWRSVVNHVVYFADKYGKVVHERRVPGGGAAVAGEGEGRLGDGGDLVLARGQPAGEHLLPLSAVRGETR
jgi:predicted nucleotidyltransferase